MRSELIIILLAIAFVIVFTLSEREREECDRKGGAMVRMTNGYKCVKVEVIK